MHKRFVVFISVLVLLLFASISFTSCRWQIDSLEKESGSLSFHIDSSKSVGIVSLEPVSYIFSGIGPDNTVFSLEQSDPSTTVEGLNIGEWTVQVDGLDENNSVILTGQSVLNVIPYGETQADIVLQPLEGNGNVSFSMEWNEEHTVAPSAVATFFDDEGIYTSQSFIISNPGFGECIVSDLPTGNYYVTVQLFDSGTLAMGSAWSVTILNEITIEVSAIFVDLNKVGERFQIIEDTFTILWDPDSQSEIPDIYRMYFRNRGEESWSLLSEVVSDIEPSFTITQDNLSFGIYEFAVSSVSDSVESDLHTSMDDTANPGTGWFVDWHSL